MPYVGGAKRLVGVSQDLSSARSLEKIMTVVRSAARDIAKSDGATFVLRDGDFCFYAEEDAISPLWKGQRFPLNTCISGWAMVNKKAVAIDDIYEDPRIPIPAYAPTFVKSLVMVPIRQENPIGAIGVYWAENHKATPEEVEMIQALADIVSLSMENLNLYEDLSKKVSELERANEAKDNFLMTVSHELRTPLNAILGWLDILREDEILKDDQHRRILDIIDRNAHVQARIVEDLLDSTRIIIGRLHLSKSEVDLIDVAKEAMTAVQFEARRRSIEINLAVESDQAIILGDGIRLRQIISNLLVNAIKFSFERGQILVTIQQRGPSFEVVVQDHGIGMSNEQIKKLFGRFYQADDSTTRKYGGLGLGLSISKHLAESHGGQINVFSKGENMGTTVVFSIPMLEKDLSARDAALEDRVKEKNKADQRLSGLHVLIVDDEPDSLALMEAVLQRSGAKVEKASSVEEALRLGRLFHFNALVSDLSMPIEDGFSFVRKVRAGHTALLQDIPAFAVTAFNDAGNLNKAMAVGFNRFFGKPFSAPQLIDALESYGGPNGGTGIPDSCPL